ncbi:MAG: hypothetical protein CMH53_00695 [Myxococcales bacterium]|nr:hypothetical protein [Myxococcales bacterium]
MRWRRKIRLIWALVLVGCTGALLPLDAPIDPDFWVERGAWVVLTNQDLQQLPAATRLAAGKQFAVSVPPVKLESGQLAGTTLNVSVLQGQASISATQDLTLTFPVTAPVTSLAWEVPNQAACALQWQWQGASLEMSFRLARDLSGKVDVTLATAPTLQANQAALNDPSNCLMQTAVGSEGSLEKQLSDIIASTLTASYVNAARSILLTVVPIDYEFSGSAQLSSDASTLDLAARFSKPTDNIASLLRHNGSYAATALDVAMNTQCHPCAEDVPPPKQKVKALPVQPATPPVTSAVLRRAVVFDKALLAHMAWAMTRNGQLCSRVSAGIESLLPTSWAADAAPSLGALVGTGPVGASFWPGQSPTIRLINRDEAAAVEWTIEDSLLEVSAPVAGVELVVLRIEGSFRLTLAPKVSTGAVLHVVDATVDSAVLSSPLVPGADLSAGGGLVAVVQAALRGIFFNGFGLSTGPSNGVVVGSTHLADQLWIWLAGGSS